MQIFVDELPYGWEKVTDPDYGVYYIDHVNRRTQYDFPLVVASSTGSVKVGLSDEAARNMKENNLAKESQNSSSSGSRACIRQLFLPKNNIELKGEFIKTQLMKSPHGLGFTIISTDVSGIELLQIKTILPNGPADIDAQLMRGDVLVYVDSHCVVGFTHPDVISLFQSIPIGSRVALEVCRGYPLPFDPDDPGAEVITTVAVTVPANRSSPPAAPVYLCGHSLSDTGAGHAPHLGILPPSVMPPCHPLSPQQHRKQASSGSMSPADRCPRSGTDKRSEGDVDGPLGLTEFTVIVVKGSDGFGFTIADSSVGQKVKHVLDHDRCRNLAEGDVLTEINGSNVRGMTHVDVVEMLKNCHRDKETVLVVQRGHPHRRRRQSSRTRPQNQGVASAAVGKASPAELNGDQELAEGNDVDAFHPGKTEISDRFSRLHHSERCCETAEEEKTRKAVSAFSENQLPVTKCISGTPDYIPASAYRNPMDVKHHAINQSPVARRQNFDCRGSSAIQNTGWKRNHEMQGEFGCASCRSGFHDLPQAIPDNRGVSQCGGIPPHKDIQTVTGLAAGGLIPFRDGVRMTVQLERQESGFGIRIVGGIEEGSQVAIGYIVPGGAADAEGHLAVGDEILAVNQQSVVGASHHHVVSLMSQSARLGFVVLEVWKQANHSIRNDIGHQASNVFDVALTRKDGEGFGFVIVSSVTKAGSIIANDFDLVEASDDWVPNFKRPYPWLGKIIDGSPAGRCEQLHIGDYILAINDVDIGSMPHQEIVNFIKASGLSIVLTVAPVNYTAIAQDSRQDLTSKVPHREEEDIFQLIELRRGSRGFGFSIRGGKEFDGMPLYILKVADDGPAQLDGRLQVGDQIVEINGCNTIEMFHTEAIDLIQNSVASLRLLIKRSINDCQHTHGCGSSGLTDPANQNLDNLARANRTGSQKQIKVTNYGQNHQPSKFMST